MSLFPVLLSNIKLTIAPHLVLPLPTFQECKTIFHLNAIKGPESNQLFITNKSSPHLH